MNSAQKIKIVRIIARLNIGGPAIHTILLTSELNPPDFESHLVCGSPGEQEGDMGYYARQKNVPVHMIPALVRQIDPVRDIRAFINIADLLRRIQPDIVHTHTAKAGFLGRSAAIWYRFTTGRKLSCLHTFHGHVFDGYFSKTKTRLFIAIEKLLARHTQAILTVSQSVKNELSALKIAAPDKIKVIPLGLELAPFLNVPAPRTDKPVRIGIVGRLVPIKNHRMFLEAARQLVTRLPGAPLEFVIAGDGELRNRLEEVARSLGLSANTHFTGWQHELATCYTSLHIVALTSLNEGTPVSLIEAMASGRPVIATRVGGVGDLLGPVVRCMTDGAASFDICQRGIAVTSNDPASLSAGLAYLINDPALRRTIVQEARKFAAATFNKDRLVQDITALYKKLHAAA